MISKLQQFAENSVNWLDKIGEMVNRPSNFMHDRLDNIRFALQSDPTERSWTNRWKQLAGYSFGLVTFIAEQPINLVRKPITLVHNIVKSGAILLGMAAGSKSTICNKDKLKQTGKEILKNTVDLVIAAASCALAVTTVGTPAAVALGAASMGSVGTAVSVGHNLGIKAFCIAMFSSPTSPIGIAMNSEFLLESIWRRFDYKKKDPTKFNEHPQEFAELKKNYNIVKDPKIDIEAKRKAFLEMQKIKSELEELNPIIGRLKKAMGFKPKTLSKEIEMQTLSRKDRSL